MESLIENFDQKKNEFAQMLVECGLNVQKGQKVFIESFVENRDMAYRCMDASYNAGASDVVIYWRSEYVNHERMKHADNEILENLNPADYAMKNEYIKKGYGFLQLRSNNPSLTDDIEPRRAKTFSKNDFAGIGEFWSIRKTGVIPWCLTCVPQVNWAKCVFPDKYDDEALAALWNAVFKALEITGDGKALERWHQHVSTLIKRSKILNDYHFKTLHYTNDLGTDLYIDLPPEHNWISVGESFTVDNRQYTSNMPSEEVFTSPLKNGVNGVVYSAKPLVLAGQTIEGIRFEFKDGKMVSISADKGEDILIAEIDANKNARYLGEVALVPYESPISKQNIVFYDGLYDENASCHLAYGDSFLVCIKDWQNLSEDEIKNIGINSSPTHVDFMVGTKDLNITGTTFDGKEIPVFENGNFAF